MSVAKRASDMFSGGEATTQTPGESPEIRNAMRAGASYEDANKVLLAGQSAGNLQAVIFGLITIGVAGYIGIFVMSETSNQVDVTDGSAFDNATTEIDNTVDVTFGFMVVIFVALLGAIALNALGGFSR